MVCPMCKVIFVVLIATVIAVVKMPMEGKRICICALRRCMNDNAPPISLPIARVQQNLYSYIPMLSSFIVKELKHLEVHEGKRIE